ncbi:MAG: hypothetical protein HY782_13270 [Chloroflexi bacterium]|nr:hypothetical protein [Chloroflexota bacterium]
MATTREQLAKLEKEVRQLKKQVAELRRERRGQVAPPKDGKRTAPKDLSGLSERERGLDILRRAGAIRAMTPEEEKLAAEWDALPEERKREVEAALWNAHIDPPLSQLIHEMRR